MYLQPTDTDFVRSAMVENWNGIWQWDDDGELKASTLKVGDNFAMNAIASSNEGQPF